MARSFVVKKLFSVLAAPVVSAGAYLLLVSLAAPEHVARMAAIAAWMAIWWILEAVPLAVTSLLPVVFYPVFGIMGTQTVAPLYMNHVLLLFIGGFIVAFAMEKWDLHKRIALFIILTIGNRPSSILFGLMFSAWLLSMWISNTATTMMLLPPAMAILHRTGQGLKENAPAGPMAIAFLLGIAYASSIGGTATLVGTPPNMIFLSQYQALFPGEPLISFAQWMMLGLPVSVVFFLIAFFYLRNHFGINKMEASVSQQDLAAEYRALGPMSFEEKTVMSLFSLLALLWISRADLILGGVTLPGWAGLFPNPGWFQDGTVAIFIALLLFVIPSKNKPGEMLLSWKPVKKLPYEVILLFGGGFALAEGFVQTGLTDWLANRMDFIAGFPAPLLALFVCLFMTFLTEVTSNMATTQMALPVFAAIALAAGIEPLLILIPATFSASFAFMLPVATAPNTIVFGTGALRVKDMAHAGLRLNLIGAVVMTAMMLLLGRWVYGV